MPKLINMLGHKDKYVIVLRRLANNKHCNAVWECVCRQCGKTFERTTSEIRGEQRKYCMCNSRATRFKEGHDTWNKGKAFQAGGRSAETRFKKGQEPPNKKPFGTPLLNISHTKDGRERIEWNVTTEEIIGEQAKGGIRRRRTSYAKYLWELHNGPVPDKHVVVNHCVDKYAVPAIESLECISRKEHAARNKGDSEPLLKFIKELDNA